MRIFTAFLILGTAIGSAAQASSFDTPEPMPGTIGPSMIAIGDAHPSASSVSFVTTQPLAQAASITPVPGAPGHAIITPSIVAIGEPVPGIAYENVAAIPSATESEPVRRLGPPLMVIRGGLAGDAFARPAVDEVEGDAAQPAAKAKRKPRASTATEVAPEVRVADPPPPPTW